MKNRNIYKDIVFLAISCLFLTLTVRAADFWFQQQKSYEIIIQSQTELTDTVVKELAKIEGLYQFTPSSSCNVTLALDEYTLETSLTGIDLTNYPLKWKSAQKEVVLGNSPVLFFGKETFASFADNNGNAPGRSRISAWMENYQDLQLTVTDESGRERRGKIGGILEKPLSGIYMSRNQMQKIYTISAKTTGGCAKIQGKRNLQRAQELLSDAGFQVE